MITANNIQTLQINSTCIWGNTNEIMGMEIVEFFFGNFWHWLGGLFYLGVIFSMPLISFTSRHNNKDEEE